MLATGCISVIVFFLDLLGLPVNDAHHLRLQCFLVLAQAVLLPRVVKDFSVEVVPGHAGLKETYHSLVVWLLFELESPAHLHELFEFVRLSFAKH